MLNHITVMGRMTRDPELRLTQSGVSVANFTLAVDRDYNKGEDKQTDFIDCTAWRHTADFINNYFRKGSMAVVDGRLQIDNYTDNDGNKRRTAKVNVDSIYFGDSKKATTDGETADGNSAAPAFTEMPSTDDETLPF